MKRAFLFLLLNILVITTCYPQKKKSAISIGPATLSFTLDKGQTATQTVYITNMLNRPYSFSLELIDWSLDTTGEDVFYEPGGVTNSCARWVTLDKTFVEIPANSKEGVNIKMTIPDSTDAVKTAKWTMLHIVTSGEKKAPKKSGSLELALTKSLAVGVRIYQFPPATITVDKEMKMLAFRPLADSNTYRIESENTGAIMLRCHYSIELSSAETGDKTTVGPLETLVLPGQVRYVDLKMPKTLAKGKYTAVALIEAGDDEVPLEAAQTEIEIK